MAARLFSRVAAAASAGLEVVALLAVQAAAEHLAAAAPAAVFLSALQPAVAAAAVLLAAEAAEQVTVPHLLAVAAAVAVSAARLVQLKHHLEPDSVVTADWAQEQAALIKMALGVREAAVEVQPYHQMVRLEPVAVPRRQAATAVPQDKPKPVSDRAVTQQWQQNLPAAALRLQVVLCNFLAHRCLCKARSPAPALSMGNRLMHKV
jgi:hypothetical protein